MAESALKLLTPNSVDVRDVGHNVAKISIEPLERGFGHTWVTRYARAAVFHDGCSRCRSGN